MGKKVLIVSAFLLITIGGWFLTQSDYGVRLFESHSSVQSNLSDEEQIELRVKERWEALRTMNIGKLYSYASPKYREIYKESHLGRQYSGQLERNEIEVVRTKIEETDSSISATVDVQMHYTTSNGIKGFSFDKQKWVKENGQWWHVEPR